MIYPTEESRISVQGMPSFFRASDISWLRKKEINRE